jgi:acetyl/propionyl-CoA carboxylase alpha subunit
MVAPPGWRNVPAIEQRRRFARPSGTTVAIGLPPANREAERVTVDGLVLSCMIHSVDDDGADLVVDGLRRRALVRSTGSQQWVTVGGWQILLDEHERFPSAAARAAHAGPAAPLPGTIVTVEVVVGDEVTYGQVLVVLEAMKMEHRITADTDGRVTAVLVAQGDRVDVHQPLVTIEPGGPS